MGFDIEEGSEVFNRLLKCEGILFNQKTKSFKFQPKVEAKNIHDLIAIVEKANYLPYHPICMNQKKKK